MDTIQLHRLDAMRETPRAGPFPDSFNAAGEYLVLAAVTSHITDDPNAVRPWRGDFAAGRLRQAGEEKRVSEC